MISSIILAAGESKRMGVAKLLLPLGKSTVIEEVLQAVLASSVDRTIVVLGADREPLEAILGKYPVRTVFNADYRTGMLSSIRAGMSGLSPETRAALIVLGDQPGISPKTINRIIESYNNTGKGLVLPVYRNSGGHPLLVDLKYRPDIEKLDPAVGLRELLALFPRDVLRVDVDDPGVLSDLDTSEDYLKKKS
jgi:molybdenum cofactor cytidylyltransferase